MTFFDDKKRLTGTVAPVLAVLMLSGCHNYLARTEGVTGFAGETVASNEVISVVDTWPDGFDDTHIPTDGERQSHAIKKYKNPPKPKAEQSGQLKLVVGD